MDNNKLIINEITAPELKSSTYGDDINAKFETINNNFTALNNIDVYKGEDGESITIENITLINDETDKDHISYKLYIALQKAISSKFSNYNEIVNNVTWDEYISNLSVPITKIGDIYIGSATPVLFCDGRFASENITSSDNLFVYEGIIDCTCIILFKYNNSESQWICEINRNFPSLKYENGNFYWILGDDTSVVKATGIKGDKGDAGISWISTAELSDDNTNEVIITQYLDKDGNFVNFDYNNGTEGDIVIVYSKTSAAYNGFFISVLKEKQISSSSDGEIYSWVVPVTENIQHINYVNNTIEFFKTLGLDNTTANGMFLLFEPTQSNPNESHAHNIRVDKDNRDNLIIEPVIFSNKFIDYTPYTDSGALHINYPETQINGHLNLGTAVADSKKSYDLNIRQGNLNVNGNATISNGLTVNNSATINSVTINSAIINSATINGELDVSDDLVVGGNLSVNNSLSVDKGLIVNKGLTINSNELVVNNSNAIINSGNLIVKNGSATINNGLTVNNSATISNGLTVNNNQTINGDLSVNGNAIISNGLTVNDNATINNGLNIQGNTNINGTLDVTGSTTIENNLYVEESVQIDNGLTVSDGGITINKGNLNVENGSATISNGLTVSDGGITINKGNLNVENGSATINGDITVGDGFGLTVKGRPTLGVKIEKGGLLIEEGNLNLGKENPKDQYNLTIRKGDLNVKDGYINITQNIYAYSEYSQSGETTCINKSVTSARISYTFDCKDHGTEYYYINNKDNPTDYYGKPCNIYISNHNTSSIIPTLICISGIKDASKSGNKSIDIYFRENDNKEYNHIYTINNAFDSSNELGAATVYILLTGNILLISWENNKQTGTTIKSNYMIPS